MIESIRKQIETKFDAEWLLKNPTVAIQWENIAFDHSDSLTWVRLTIIDGSGVNLTLGRNKKIEQLGSATVQVFVERNTGTALVRQYVDDVIDIFRHLILIENNVTINFLTPFAQEADSGDARYYQKNVICNFKAEESQPDAT